MNGNMLDEHGMIRGDGVQFLPCRKTLFAHERVVKSPRQNPLAGRRAGGALAQARQTVLKRAAFANGRRVEIFPVEHGGQQDDMPVRIAESGHDRPAFHVAQPGFGAFAGPDRPLRRDGPHRLRRAPQRRSGGV